MLTPARRIALVSCLTAVVGGLCVLAQPQMAATLAAQQNLCRNGTTDPSATWCRLVLDYPNRLPAAIIAASVVVFVILAFLAGRWCLQPFRQLVDVIEQMGPTNLGQRVGTAGRPDALGSLSAALNALMDRIAAGYASQRRFAANASHELRTPLAVQRTLIEVGLNATLTDDQVNLLTMQLLAANRRNEQLIEGLLTLAEAEQTAAGHTPQRLDHITEEVVELHQNRARAANVELSCVVVPSTVRGERVLLERLITNLIQNAIIYNVDAGTVDVTVEPGLLSVINTGPAIRPDEVDGLFEPFRRRAGERLSYSDGAGLGLTITAAITSTHDARIRAEPGPNGGLAVRVEFPSRQQQAIF